MPQGHNVTGSFDDKTGVLSVIKTPAPPAETP